ncbi:low choriolytic enzyme-like [Toxotes jaculatrix]|uniref:low choriolytic enzyme-like n=1 Tax=Toxotes jaculatrix TaxID=941984 RepID=UPI001B3B015E|nr:low choriolytic enzyme-like [Toxotes jaculatrix]
MSREEHVGPGFAIKEDDEGSHRAPRFLLSYLKYRGKALRLFGNTAAMNCILALLALTAVSAWIEAGVVKRPSGDNNDEDEGDLTVSEQLEKANNNLNRDHNGIQIDGDIAVSRLPTLRNADPCVLRGCMWPKTSDGKVYIPYVIANHYSFQELDIIKRAINSFSYSTCIRFFPRSNQRDYLYIQSLNGCYSYVGRQGNGQTVSLSRQGCIYYGTIQHELLHALGFNHEHCRSDRDQHIQVLLQNVIHGQEHNFRKISTLNQGTPYDYDSVMHYGRLAFSKDKYSPTMVAVSNTNAAFGTAKQMSQNDINRINLLYCKNWLH